MGHRKGGEPVLRSPGPRVDPLPVRSARGAPSGSQPLRPAPPSGKSPGAPEPGPDSDAATEAHPAAHGRGRSQIAAGDRAGSTADPGGVGARSLLRGAG